MKQIIVLFFVAVMLSAGLRADALPEYTLKAAYLYNFALLTDWPKEEESTGFNMCFYKENLGSASDALQNKIVGNKKVKVLNVTTAEEAKGCQMLFIPESEGQNGEKMIRQLVKTPVLIVSENASSNDAHIVIIREGRKLAFDISLKALKYSNLLLSSRLLKLARKVEQ
ncbi:MAG: YfiR family protein [Sulfuricurvum sp.]|uniref:YfiR family protein n=1 Tax=Sulfuricurvum sp. TaxID=2025608 RepID=UPI00261DB2CD|nr:YfiR family protein [Sulfuricurvum sp.]MDD2830032.1 YfiR family protein [Sulfuricurvum sp.]MDD4948353.1 YfiR family protein [Sulfuricurvum sp.]